jgi:hypothetical protein
MFLTRPQNVQEGVPAVLLMSSSERSVLYGFVQILFGPLAPDVVLAPVGR